jgi:hypothetical protein
MIQSILQIVLRTLDRADATVAEGLSVAADDAATLATEVAPSAFHREPQNLARTP